MTSLNLNLFVKFYFYNKKREIVIFSMIKD